MHKGPKVKTDMIIWLQVKFVAVAMSILILVFLVMLSAINMLMETVSQSQSLRLLVQIAESDRYETLTPAGGTVPEQNVIPSTPEPAPLSNHSEGDVITVQHLAYRYNEWEDWEETDNWEDDWQNNDDWQDGTMPEPPPKPTEPWEEPNHGTDWQPPDYPWMTETTPAEPTIPAVTDPTTAAPPETDVPTLPPATEDLPVVLPETIQTTEQETTTTTTVAPSEEDTAAAATTQETPPPPKDPPLDKWNITITLEHFAIQVDRSGNFCGIRNTEDYTQEEAQEIMQAIMQRGENQGMYGWLQYYMTPKDYGTLIVLTDKTAEQGLLNQLFMITVIVGCIVLAVLFVFLCILSRWITNPVRTAFIRQKQFVSDAGHELKTPLTILSANADILRDEIGENKWLGYMQEQTGRMNQLVGDLLRLARMDNATQEYVFEEFNLSTAVTATALPFESQAYELRKNLELDIQPGVTYTGSEQHIRQLAAIFIDNALKYSDEDGVIRVTLLQKGDHAVMEFYNTGCEISPEETEKIFERFYRGDKARGSKGKSGYGLGLSIAKGIMEVHKIKIQVTCEQGKWIRFLLTL